MINITDDLRYYYNSNMKEKTPLELEKENRILQSNWNSLREWLEEEYKKYDIGTKTYGQAQVKETLNKMNELEGRDKNEIDLLFKRNS